VPLATGYVSLTDWLAIAGLGIGLIGAIAGIIAAAYAWKAFRSSERSGSTADRRYALQIEPRVQLQYPVKRSGVDGSITARISNAGGAAKAYVILLNESDSVHLGRGSMPEHASLDVQLRWLGIQVAGIPYQTVAVTVAQDVEDRWWDCLTHTVVTDWQAWLDEHPVLFDAGAFEQTGLPLVPGP
jgi:hypothetical protein